MLTMFALDPLHPLFTRVLEAVAATPSITVAELHVHLKKQKVPVTLQHLYRTVNRLVEAQILLKTGAELTVNFMWLSYIEFFAQRAKQTAEEKGTGQIVPLKPGERKVLKVETLFELQTLWNHLLVQLHRVAPEKALYKYYSHAWWQLGTHALDPRFYRRIMELGVRCYWVFGNTTFLDRHAAELHKDLMSVRLVDHPPFPKEGYNLNVFGPYILECIFPERISKHFDFIFHNVGKWEQFDEEVFSDIFLLQCPMTLKLWHNEQQAAEMRAKVEQCFLRKIS